MTGDPLKPWSTTGRAAGREPFHVTEDGFEVFETDREGRFTVSHPRRPNTYFGDLAGVANFIERERKAA
jgi:hypothetical protein